MVKEKIINRINKKYFEIDTNNSKKISNKLKKITKNTFVSTILIVTLGENSKNVLAFSKEDVLENLTEEIKKNQSMPETNTIQNFLISIILLITIGEIISGISNEDPKHVITAIITGIILVSLTKQIPALCRRVRDAALEA